MNNAMLRYTGGCLCGSVRFVISESPTTVYACHCSDCQTASGSSFVLAMRVPHGSISVIKGDVLETIRSREDGREKKIFRCPKCLSALWGKRLDSPEYCTVYVGTLDNSADIEPVGHIWTSDAQDWIHIPEDVLSFEYSPPNMEVFEREWSRRTRSG